VLTSRLPMKFAITGLVTGSIWMCLYFLDYKYNPFHLPPPPPLYRVLESTMFVLCPGLLLQFFAMGTSDRVAYLMWAVAICLNVPVYYLIGLLISSMAGRRSGALPDS